MESIREAGASTGVLEKALSKKRKRILLVLLLAVLTFAGVYNQYWRALYHPEVAFQPMLPETQTGFESGTPGASQSAQPDGVEDPRGPGETKAEDRVDQRSQESGEPENNGDAQEKNGKTINFLVLGTDGNGGAVSRTDAILFASANLETHQVSMISIPRDTRVDIEGVGRTKINHANVLGALDGGVHQGTLKSIQAVTNLLGVPIHYYAKIDFQGFVKAVDAVGGIDITLAETIHDPYVSIYLSAGDHHLSGEEALRLARVRKTIRGGDFGRQKHQFLLLAALAQKILSPANIENLPELFGIVKENFTDTNLSVSETLSLGIAFKGINPNQITYNQLPGHAIMAWDPVMDMKLFFFEPDIDGVKKIVAEAVR
ncbi:MAG TPA: LytR family transcriptional regulator [Peptococcaceae bacterium]|nr:LytR family transcriptional regulator [Peptococcaceae bacterium]